MLRLRPTIPLLILSTLSAGAAFCSDMEVVGPHVHARAAGRGETYAGAVFLTNNGAAPLLLQANKVAGGGISEARASNADWLSLELPEQVILPHQTAEVRYSVSVPKLIREDGNYLSTFQIMAMGVGASRQAAPSEAVEISLVSRIGEAKAAELKLRTSTFVQSGATVALQLEWLNIGRQATRCEMWLDIYDQSDEYIRRIDTAGLMVPASEIAVAQIDLSALNIGKYRAIVVAKYESRELESDLRQSETVVRHLPSFLLALNRSRELVASSLSPSPVATTTAPTSRAQSELSVVRERIQQQRKSALAELASNALVSTEPIVDMPAVTSQPTAEPLRKQVASTPSDARIQISGADELEPEPLPSGGVNEQYVVRKGDWLSKIALRYYGDMMRYDEIFAANRDLIDNPDLIFPGQELEIPTAQDNKIIAANHEIRNAGGETTQLLAPEVEIDGRLAMEKRGARLGFGCNNSGRGQEFHGLIFTRMISVPLPSNSYWISSMREERIKMPRPLSFSRFSGASGSLTFSGLKPVPSSFIRTRSLFS